MCKCDHNIPFLFCGRPGCEVPRLSAGELKSLREIEPVTEWVPPGGVFVGDWITMEAGEKVLQLKNNAKPITVKLEQVDSNGQ